MANEIVALQGHQFSIDLQSMSASTGFLWVLTSLPEGIALVRTETIAAPMSVMRGQTTQRFWFGAISETKDKAEIEFTQVRLSHMTTGSKHTVLVTVIPSDSKEFAKFSENSDPTVDPVCNAAMPYGLVLGNRDIAFKYGYPCDNGDIIVKYGYPCGVQDAMQCCEDSCASQHVVKYGYPTGPVVKYGFPDTGLKYGYPCGVQDATQCCEDSCQPVVKYGYPDFHLKYGYPCGVQDATLKYGFPRVK